MMRPEAKGHAQSIGSGSSTGVINPPSTVSTRFSTFYYLLSHHWWKIGCEFPGNEMPERQNNDYKERVSHMGTDTQQKDSKSKGRCKSNNGASCCEQVSVSFVLYDVITHRNARLAFCLFYNQRLGDMEVKENKQWDHMHLNVFICNPTLQPPVICWQDNRGKTCRTSQHSHRHGKQQHL